MSIVPASSYLTDFSQEGMSDQPQIAPTEAQVEEVTSKPVELLPELELIIDPPSNHPERDQVANDEANKVEIAEALSQQEVRLKAIHQAEIENLNTTFYERLTQNFTHQFELCLSRVEEEISQGVLAVIEPFLDESVKEQAMLELLQTVEGIKHDLKSTTVTLRGNENELDRLSPSLESMGLQVNRLVAEAEEVSLEFDDMWIETRFERWKKSLSQRSKSQVNP